MGQDYPGAAGRGFISLNGDFGGANRSLNGQHLSFTDLKWLLGSCHSTPKWWSLLSCRAFATIRAN